MNSVFCVFICCAIGFIEGAFLFSRMLFRQFAPADNHLVIVWIKMLRADF